MCKNFLLDIHQVNDQNKTKNFLGSEDVQNRHGYSPYVYIFLDYHIQSNVEITGNFPRQYLTHHRICILKMVKILHYFLIRSKI